MLLSSCFFALMVFLSFAEHRFINFDTKVSGNCQRPIAEVQFSGLSNCPFPQLSWNTTAEDIHMINYSYFSRPDLESWKRKLFEEKDISSSRNGRLCEFLYLLHAPPCAQIMDEKSSQTKHVIAPPCRSYCKSAQLDYTSQF